VAQFKDETWARDRMTQNFGHFITDRQVPLGAEVMFLTAIL
jgi:hypothetical protein